MSTTSSNGSATAESNGNGNDPQGAHARSRYDDEGMENPLYKLTDEQIEQLGKEFDELHDQVKEDLGDRDAAYIRAIIDMHRRLALLGRVMLIGSRNKGMLVAGTSVVGLGKILENMEIGHNVLHGQWDWMNDPVINSQSWDWDTASTAESWRHSHNYIHHTYTNIRGLDKDLGYEIMRIDPHQKWHPVYLLQPIYNIALMLLFEWGVAFHDMDLEAVRSGDKSQKEVFEDLKGIGVKARQQVVKDYIAWPAISALVAGGVTYAFKASGIEDKIPSVRPSSSKRARAKGKLRDVGGKAKRRGRASWLVAKRSDAPTRRVAQLQTNPALAAAIDVARDTYKRTAYANAVSNLMRNVWAYAIIFCGHFPDQTYTFSKDETEDESRGAKYVRQLIGAANIEGGPIFHIISGNLGYQVEHHLYPDMPSSRYGEIAPKVREICKRYELPYNTGPFFQQIGMVQRTILRLAFPGGKPRPKPGPYKGPEVINKGEGKLEKTAGAS
jgi:linoleoyl-CoA desaturase